MSTEKMNVEFEHIENERLRLKQVRVALSTALEGGARGDAAYVPFYIAIADYMEKAFGRLHHEDGTMCKVVRRKVANPTPDVIESLDEVEKRLARSNELLQNLVRARDALKKTGGAALQAFEAAGRDYTHHIKTKMGYNAPTSANLRAFLTEDDWKAMAGETKNAAIVEKELFKKVFAAKPASLTIDAA